MIRNRFSLRPSSRHLFLGSAFTALSVSLAAPALAVPPSSSQIDARGAQHIANKQSKTDAAIEASATNPVIEAIIEPTQASITLSGNSASATATANRQGNTLASDSLHPPTVSIDTHLATNGDRLTAYAPAVIAAQQTADDAPVRADADFTYIGMIADDVVESSLATIDNRQEALAASNDAASTISLSGNNGGTGAGIASRQSISAASDVSASMAGVSRIVTQEVVRSDVAMDGNLQRAIATGNGATNALSTDVLSIEDAASYGTPSTVRPYGGAEVNAAYAILSDQHSGGDVSATADGGFRSVAADSVVDSSVSADRNALAAAAYGNEAGNSAALTANSIDTGYRAGASANVTNVQTADGAVAAETYGGTTIKLLSDLLESSVSAAGNRIQSIATANRADGNLLAVRATSITAADGYQAGEEDGPEYVGTARLTPFGEMTVTAPFSVQNAQSFNAPVSASMSESSTRVKAKAEIVGSIVAVQDNDARVAASGNSGTNGLLLDANSIATAADLNSSQTGHGDVQATVGHGYDRAGVRIAARGDVVDSSLSVAGNDTQGTAIANDVVNSLGVVGNKVANASGHTNAVAGLPYDDLVASADYALANFQGVGASNSHSEGESESGGVPQISSRIAGGITARGDSVIRSSVAIEGNSQTATALANLASNDLSIEATSLGGDMDTAPGSALSSTQVGVADLWATSDLKIGATGHVVDGSIAVSNNRNVALAHMNDAANQANIGAVQIGTLSGTDAELFTDPGMPGLATGDQVLASSQFANGSVTATALTVAGNPDENAVLSRSSYTITGNGTMAEAVANQAISGLSISAASAGEASAGLVNTQESHAGVLAESVTQFGFVGTAMSDAQVLVDGNTTNALARGNAASNSLILAGTPAIGWTPASASLTGSGTASAAATLANGQMNTGDVTAISENTDYEVALNCIGVEGSELVLNGNSVSASAFGNNATNGIMLASLGRLPTATVASIQTNSGQITAQASGATFKAVPGTLTASRLNISGNNISASAVGNSAVTSIASSR